MEFTIQVTVINFHSFYDRTNKYFTKQAYQRHNVRLLIIYLALQREIENNKKKIYNYSHRCLNTTFENRAKIVIDHLFNLKLTLLISFKKLMFYNISGRIFFSARNL